MKPSLIYKGLLAVAIIATTAMSFHPVQAACGTGSACCPKCKTSCSLKAEKVDVEKSCFEVESKTICIPRVVFPWQMPKKKSNCSSCDGYGCSTCVNNGATARTVRILKTKKYKCPECKYTWSAKEPCCSGGCASGGCASSQRGCASMLGGYAATTVDQESPKNFVEAPQPEPYSEPEPYSGTSVLPVTPVVAKLPAALR